MAVTPEVRAAAGKELSRRLIVEDRALGAAISAKGPIAVYLASKEEIDLADFITAALSFGCAVVAPRWNGTDYELVRLQDFATLVKGAHSRGWRVFLLATVRRRDARRDPGGCARGGRGNTTAH